MIVSITNKQRRQAIISCIIAIVLATLIKFNVILPAMLDNSIHSWFTNIQTGYGDVVMAIATFLGNPVVDVVYILILAGVLIIAKLHIPAIWTIATIISGDAFIAIVKAIAGVLIHGHLWDRRTESLSVRRGRRSHEERIEAKHTSGLPRFGPHGCVKPYSCFVVCIEFLLGSAECYSTH